MYTVIQTGAIIAHVAMWEGNTILKLEETPDLAAYNQRVRKVFPIVECDYWCRYKATIDGIPSTDYWESFSMFNVEIPVIVKKEM